MSHEHLYQQLPAAAAAAMRQFLALGEPPPPPTLGTFKSLRVTFTPGLTTEQKTLLSELFTAVSWPNAEQLIPLPAALTAPQRAVAQLLAESPALLYEWAIPTRQWARRRWLGLEPQGVLEQDISLIEPDGTETRAPLWRVLCAFIKDYGAAGNTLRFNAMWKGLPLMTRIEAYGDICLGAYNIKSDHVQAPIEWSMGDEGKAWAPAFADRIIAYQAANGAEINEWLRRIVCICLLRAKVPFAARWEPLLFLEQYSPLGEEVSLALIKSLPAERHSAVILQLMKGLFAHHAMKVVLRLLPVFPLVELAQYVMDNCADIDYYPRRDILKKLQRIAASHPRLAALVDPFMEAQPPFLKLVWQRQVEVKSIEGLSPIQRAQCGVGADGMTGLSDNWLSDEVIAFLRVGTIADEEGKVLYDTAVMGVEDGTVFRHGTTEPVAWLCQFSLSCQDPGLKESLQPLLVYTTKARRELEDAAQDEEQGKESE